MEPQHQAATSSTKAPMQNQVQFAIACFFVFFGLGNFLLWLRNATFMYWPLMVIGGFGLAMASNFSARSAWPFNLLPNLMNRKPGDLSQDGEQ